MSVLGKFFESIRKFISGDWDDKVGSAVGSVISDATDSPSTSDAINFLTTTLGQSWNNLSGATAQNNFIAEQNQLNREWSKMLSDTEISRRVKDIKDAGLSPTLFYASGGNGASTPSSGSTSSGSGSAMDVFGSIGSIMNSVNTARELDLKTGRDQMPNRTTTEIYDALGNVVQQIVKTSSY